MFGSKRNLDGGPKTAVFAFSLERERETAHRLAGPDQADLLAARLALIDEVQAYRETGLFTNELLRACEAELEVAPRNRPSLNVMTVGLKRLCELAADGHVEAADRVRREFAHPRAERRVTAYELACAVWLNKAERISACLAMLEDPSSDVRQIGAAQVARDGFHELTNALYKAADTTKGARARERILLDAFHLTERHRLGLPVDARLPDASWVGYNQGRSRDDKE